MARSSLPRPLGSLASSSAQPCQCSCLSFVKREGRERRTSVPPSVFLSPFCLSSPVLCVYVLVCCRCSGNWNRAHESIIHVRVHVRLMALWWRKKRSGMWCVCVWKKKREGKWWARTKETATTINNQQLLVLE